MQYSTGIYQHNCGKELVIKQICSQAGVKMNGHSCDMKKQRSLTSIWQWQQNCICWKNLRKMTCFPSQPRSEGNQFYLVEV
jgi:hypothetical protein